VKERVVFREIISKNLLNDIIIYIYLGLGSEGGKYVLSFAARFPGSPVLRFPGP
jgi:hypothetical protein